MMERIIKEKRLFRRYPCNLGGDFKSSEDEGEIRVKDISALGAGLIITKPLKVDAPLKLKIFTKKQFPIICTGKVRWCREKGSSWHIGVAFDEPLFLPLVCLV
jgi:hypothetical protein